MNNILSIAIAGVWSSDDRLPRQKARMVCNMLLIRDQYRYLLIVGFCFFSLSHWCFKIAVNFLLGFSSAGLCQKHTQGTKELARPQQEGGTNEQNTSDRLRARGCEDCRYSRWQMSIEISERSLFLFFGFSVVVCPRSRV